MPSGAGPLCFRRTLLSFDGGTYGAGMTDPQNTDAGGLDALDKAAGVKPSKPAKPSKAKADPPPPPAEASSAPASDDPDALGDAAVAAANAKPNAVRKAAMSRAIAELGYDKVPSDHRFARMSREALASKCASRSIPVWSFYDENDLGLLLLADESERARRLETLTMAPAQPPSPTPPKDKGLAFEVPPSPTGKYRVLEGGNVPQPGGAVAHIAKDDIIDVRHYGPKGLATMLSCGVKLMPIQQ